MQHESLLLDNIFQKSYLGMQHAFEMKPKNHKKFQSQNIVCYFFNALHPFFLDHAYDLLKSFLT